MSTEVTHLFPSLQVQRYKETKVLGNRSAQFRVITVAQQLFRVTLCVTSNLK
jgi:hypothetical protein